MSLQHSVCIWQLKKISWVTTSQSMHKSVAVPALFSLFRIQCNRVMLCREAGEEKAWVQECATLEGLCGPKGCAREQDLFGTWLGFLPPPSVHIWVCTAPQTEWFWSSFEITFPQNREVLVESPHLMAFQQGFFSPYSSYVTLCLTVVSFQCSDVWHWLPGSFILTDACPHRYVI